MSLHLALLLKPELPEILASGDVAGIREIFEELHAADLAGFFDDLDEPSRIRLFEHLSIQQQIELFTYFPPEDQESIVGSISTASRIRLLNELNPDDRVDFFSELPQSIAERLLSELSPRERLYTLAILRCPESSAGRMMTQEFISLRADMTVDEALQRVREKSGSVETIYVSYVLDRDNKLVGTVSLRDLLRASGTDLVDYIMTIDPIHVFVTTDQEEVAEIASKYDLMVLPVTTADLRLVGIVTYDDIHDVQAEEVSEDILRMHGVGAAEGDYFNASIKTKLMQRSTVIVSLFGASIISVLLQDHFNYLVERVSVLAVFITLLNGSSGNCGTQMAGIIIRGQNMPELQGKQMVRLVMREIVVGVMIATFMAMAVAALVFIMNPSSNQLGNNELWRMSMAVGIAMFCSLTIINFLGGFIPILMKRIKLDPTLTSGPFITTAADVVTVVLYFWLTGLFLN